MFHMMHSHNAISHWKLMVALMQTFSSLAASQVLMTTITGTSSDDQSWNHDNFQFSVHGCHGIIKAHPQNAITVLLHVYHGIPNHLQLYCFSNSLFRLESKQTTKLYITGHFLRESTGPCTKGQLWGKHFYFLMSSCSACIMLRMMHTPRDHFVYEPANERWHYNATSCFIGWVHTQNDLHTTYKIELRSNSHQSHIWLISNDKLCVFLLLV